MADLIDHPGIGADHPPQYARDCPHCQRIARLCKGFRDFGYAGLTMDECREAYNLAMTRDVTAADGIIAMLTRSQLVEAGLVA